MMVPWLGIRRSGGAVAGCLLGAAVAGGLATADALAAGQDSGRNVCISAWKESLYRNYAYDHVVGIRNDCDAAVRCSVTTNVNPRRVEATVAAGKSTRVLTYRGAPQRAFTARVACVAD